MQYNVLYYKYIYKYSFCNNYLKDLYIITNYANCHYKFLFWKTHNAQKIKDKILFNILNNNANLKSNNIKNIIYNTLKESKNNNENTKNNESEKNYSEKRNINDNYKKMLI